jgi:hypothetical protein
VDDPLEDAIGQAMQGLDDRDASEFRRLVREGLEHLDTTAPPEFIAREEIAPAAALAPDERLAWAQEFALTPSVRRLNQRAWQLVTDLQDGNRNPAELAAEAEGLLGEVQSVDLSPLDGEGLRRVQRLRNEAIADINYVISGGTGPASLRGGHRLGRTGKAGPGT